MKDITTNTKKILRLNEDITLKNDIPLNQRIQKK